MEVHWIREGRAKRGKHPLIDDKEPVSVLARTLGYMGC